ncbi:hypothetical protein CLV57_3333 [Mucilaginibacter auburnensis]|uniref:Uncharacterized protein n=2 Tax=Mucilaginibacter auburnensis TaxID=1457233 RepID=A0A2H9VPD5_9SPHI|nr:hypothetical protein CLV57_3333 [Mucilaginibacter auburnensis]
MLAFGCRSDRKVNTSFYYWKTRFTNNATQANYLSALKTRTLYVRIMDIDIDEESGKPVPVSPIVFNEPVPDTLQAIPVVFIVNRVFYNITQPQLNELAVKITAFVKAKLKQAGKSSFDQIQIDCDWTINTRDNYFYLLNQLNAQPALKNKLISATLRLHQLKNRQRNGVPPVQRVMLMCYNMGNLRKYGNQNSILDVNELKKYAASNLADYPLPLDVGFPLFNWAVVFRNKQYAGLSKKLVLNDLKDGNHFIFIEKNQYRARMDIPQYGILKNDEVRWEDTELGELEKLALHLSPLIKNDTLNLIYFHLDENVIKSYKPQQLQETADLLR